MSAQSRIVKRFSIGGRKWLVEDTRIGHPDPDSIWYPYLLKLDKDSPDRQWPLAVIDEVRVEAMKIAQRMDAD